MFGESGHDMLYGEDGDDTLYGEEGNDRFVSRDGKAGTTSSSAVWATTHQRARLWRRLETFQRVHRRFTRKPSARLLI